MKTPEEIADEIVGMGEEAALRECDPEHDNAAMLVCSACLRSMIAAAISAERKRATFTDPIEFDVDAISAERSAGTSPNDRLVTPKLAVAARSAPAPVRPPAVRVPTPEEIAAMPLEQVAAETARLKRETGAVGGISRCEPAPACARCGGSGEIVAHASAVRNPGGGIERIVRRFAPCPECRGTP